MVNGENVEWPMPAFGILAILSFGIRHSAFSIDDYSHSMVEGGLELMS
jgi:hypothetical protein